jgi:pimeloyl-ACP methyl ester carboxylesterase
MRIVLVHGAATTSRVWAGVVAELPEFEVLTPERPSSGDLESEVAFLAPMCEGAVVGGVSGGATLGLALAAAGVPLHAAVLHEPAAGSLVPGLLDAVAAAYQAGGVVEFASSLYGPLWSAADGPDDDAAVARDLAMFRGYEPAAPADGAGPVLLTVGGDSPPIRHQVAAALTAVLGLPGRTIPGVRHAVHLEAPQLFAALLVEAATGTPGRPG